MINADQYRSISGIDRHWYLLIDIVINTLNLIRHWSVLIDIDHWYSMSCIILPILVGWRLSHSLQNSWSKENGKKGSRDNEENRRDGEIKLPLGLKRFNFFNLIQPYSQPLNNVMDADTIYSQTCLIRPWLIRISTSPSKNGWEPISYTSFTD